MVRISVQGTGFVGLLVPAVACGPPSSPGGRSDAVEEDVIIERAPSVSLGMNVDASETTGERFFFEIRRGGGVAGLTTGCRVNQDGKVVRLRIVAGHSDTFLVAGNVTDSRVQALRQDLEESPLMRLQRQETGNMTSVFTYARADTTVTWTWTTRSGTPLLRSWFAAIEDCCNVASATPTTGNGGQLWRDSGSEKP